MSLVQGFELGEGAFQLREEGACVFNILKNEVRYASQWSRNNKPLHSVYLTLVIRLRWNSDPRKVRTSEPGDRRLCSRRVNRRAVFRRVRSGESPIDGNTVTVIMEVVEVQVK